MSNYNDRYDPNSMDNYMDDLYYDEHYGSSGSKGGYSGGGGYSSSGSSSLGDLVLGFFGIVVIIFGLMLAVALPPLGVLVILGGYKLIEG